MGGTTRPKGGHMGLGPAVLGGQVVLGDNLRGGHPILRHRIFQSVQTYFSSPPTGNKEKYGWLARLTF